MAVAYGRPRIVSRPEYTLDELAALDFEALGELYRHGWLPDSIAALDGQPQGRMLAVRGLDRGVAGRVVASVAGWGRFPWGGKSFRADDARRGRGINRVRLGGRHQLFPFITDEAHSMVDGGPCIRLDYDLTVNPGVIRAIHDEVRLVGDGMFLGPAMVKRASGAVLVLWFGLDARAQAAAPVWG